jgi:hypothetical protein
MRHSKLIIAAFMFLILLPGVANAACRDILEQGIRNTYQNVKSSDLRTAYAQGFCNSYQQSSGGDTGAGFGVSLPIEGIPVDFNGNYNDSRVQSVASSSCGNSSSNLNDSNYEYLLTATADPRIVEAWSRCEQQGGLYLEGRVQGSSITLTARFRTLGSLVSSTLISDPEISGASCPNIMKEGKTITTTSVSTICQRFGNEPVTIIMNTDNSDAAIFYLPTVDNSPPTPTVEEKCEGGVAFVRPGKCKCLVPASALANWPPLPNGARPSSFVCETSTTPGKSCGCSDPTTPFGGELKGTSQAK